jgi:hypothetical protein
MFIQVMYLTSPEMLVYTLLTNYEKYVSDSVHKLEISDLYLMPNCSHT